MITEAELIMDYFAGGGGASTAIEIALARGPDLAINHDPEALAMHAVNHPTTRHFIENVWRVDPRSICAGRPVGLAWFSPDCKHHSKAKGGKPREQKIRGLAWVAVTCATRVRPRVIILENVEEFRDWGPLHRQHTTGCRAQTPKRTSACSPGCRIGMPIVERRGETFRAFVHKLERKGYVVEHRLLRACDFGAATTRRRLFLIARCDSQPIVWPEATHGAGRLHAHRAVTEILNWTIANPSIFEVKRRPSDKTLARVARGLHKFVLEAKQPLLQGSRERFSVPYLVHRSNGERVGQAPRIYDPKAPLGTIVAQGLKHALCTATLVPLAHLRGTEKTRALQVAALLRQHAYTVDDLATCRLHQTTYVVVDIGMRMLTPRELFNAQGFPKDYGIELKHEGKPLPKTAQIRMCGNSVSPPVAAALLRANLGRSTS